jgi:hypothetical protein
MVRMAFYPDAVYALSRVCCRIIGLKIPADFWRETVSLRAASYCRVAVGQGLATGLFPYGIIERTERGFRPL